MIIGILREPEGENRVAILPETVQELIKKGNNILVEDNAGSKAFAYDSQYTAVGATVKKRSEVLNEAQLILSIHPLSMSEFLALQPTQAAIGQYNLLGNKDFLKQLSNCKASLFSMDLVPRITRGQAMDVLSSMATVAGYKAVLEAASLLPTFFPMFMTAAGTIKPAKVLILGAGVAGLQAIAIARKLGAQVEVFDVRSEVKEQVESLGGKFVVVQGAAEDASAGGYAVEQSEEFKKRQKQAIHDHAIRANVIITTAQIPGKKAPVLLEKNTIQQMLAGSVIIDLAASSGGNTELTQANTNFTTENGVMIVGKTDFPSEMPLDASRMYGKNMFNFIQLIAPKAELSIDLSDEVVKQTCVLHQGQFISDRIKTIIS